jgi:HlyD family secretion protein
MKPELFIRAQRLFKVAQERSSKAIHDALDAPDAAGKRRKVVLLIGGGVLGLAVIIFIITHFITAPRQVGEPVEQIQSVTAVQVEPHEFNPVIALTGEARPQRDIHVFAPASGVRVLQLLADEGDYVRAGQPLARLDVALSTAQVRSAEASVAEARAEALRARGEYNRAESIRDSGALSTEAIEQRRAAATAADARLAASQAGLAETNARLQGGYVRAPIGGLVISRSVQLGAMVDQQEMFRIAGDNALEIAADISESDILSLERGQTASFFLSDGGVISAHVSRLPASIDERTRTGEALFALPRGTRVRAGMHLRGEVSLGTRSALAVPQASILYESGQAYVFIIGDDGIARRADVNVGMREGDVAEITSGLDQGARIAGAGAAFIKDGDKVRPIAPAPSPAESQPQRGAGLDLRGREG